jgi:SAM-dependent methyltransferase
MAAWSSGYFTDIQYTSHFYPQLAPGFMAFACLRQGVRPPALGPGTTYLELGCGQGLSLNLLAAANPSMSFWGVDFHPGQIDNAVRLARAAGLANITFEDLSFAQVLALPEGRLPRFDIIALHGIYSWVDAGRRGEIVQILDRLLKPGGMVYISYNALPGWAPLVPLQRFVAGHAARGSGDPEARVVAALRAAQQMAEDKARYFEGVPAVRQAIERALKEKPAYLVHEYLNEGSEPQFHADVARDLEGARLAFAASANVADDLLNLAAPEPSRPMIQAAADPVWRETLLDYASGKQFRRDVFVRGRNALPRPELDALLAETRFALLAPAPEAFEITVPVGRLKGDPEVYQPIFEALAKGPRSYGELAALPPLAGRRDSVLLQAVTLLVGARRIHPLAETEAGTDAARGFNRAVISRLAYDPSPAYVAAPGVGTGVHAEVPELLAIGAALEGETDVAQVARGGAETMVRTGSPLLKDGAPLEPAAYEAELLQRIKTFKTARLPLLKRLGVV